MSYSVGLVNLGCAKNQVDGERMLAALHKAGYRIEPDAARADAVVVNTCGFIDAAKREAIGEILECARLKKEGKIRAVIVTGCLAERYRRQVRKEMPEVDAVAGIGADGQIADIVGKALRGEKEEVFPDKTLLPLCGERELLSPPWTAYLKISEGCGNRCSYCAIPAIRGRYRSRPPKEIEEEARALASRGVKELVLIAQDTMRYGLDLTGRLMLPALLRRLCRIEGIEWIRVLYGYPDAVTDELLRTMAEERKVVPYIDLPLQHCDEEILRSMRRGGNRKSLEALVRKMRAAVPGLVVRTTLIAGYPGETEEQFGELCDFVKANRFERLGCFAYSQEEGTPAAGLPGQIDGEEKRRRAQIVSEIQMGILQEMGEQMKGRTLRVLVEGRESDWWFGRSYREAPDVDGEIYFRSAGAPPSLGEFIRVKITDCTDGELSGVAVR